MNNTSRERLAHAAGDAARRRSARDDHFKRAMTARPKLTADTAVDYIDWLTSNLDALEPHDIAHHFTAAELVVRVHMGNAQAKATQHTLVQDGVIDPPPQAS